MRRRDETAKHARTLAQQLRICFRVSGIASRASLLPQRSGEPTASRGANEPYLQQSTFQQQRSDAAPPVTSTAQTPRRRQELAMPPARNAVAVSLTNRLGELAAQKVQEDMLGLVWRA